MHENHPNKCNAVINLPSTSGLRPSPQPMSIRNINALRTPAKPLMILHHSDLCIGSLAVTTQQAARYCPLVQNARATANAKMEAQSYLLSTPREVQMTTSNEL
jgi:hypothetical protein